MGREEPRDTIAELDRQRARIHFLKRKRARFGQPCPHHLRKLAAELCAVALDVELKVEPQTARVPIG